MEPEHRHQFGCDYSTKSSSGLKSSKLGFSRFCSKETNGMNVAENDDDDDDGCNEGSGNRFGTMISQLPPQYPRQSVAQMGYRVVSSILRENEGHGRIGSNLVRQNSSPAGLLSHLHSQNGCSRRRGIVSYTVANGDGNEDLSPSSNRFKNHIHFSSPLSAISEVENENGWPHGLNEAKVGNSSGDNFFFSSGFPSASWNDSSYFAENNILSSAMIKRELDYDPHLFLNTEVHAASSKQTIENSPNAPSAGLAAMEKLLQLQDSVACKARAKRGCATHPRSIAERVRRSRISEGMRKLQELVPNMTDKQTNTADMLDLAVDYIKGLQKQYKTLIDIRTNCECSAFPRVD